MSMPELDQPIPTKNMYSIVLVIKWASLCHETMDDPGPVDNPGAFISLGAGCLGIWAPDVNCVPQNPCFKTSSLGSCIH
jgi:hypothetical protein